MDNPENTQSNDNVLITGSIWRRFLAYVIDYGILALFFKVIGVSFSFKEKLPDETIFTGNNVNIYVLVGFILYYVLFHYFLGYTPGKFITRIKIVAKNNNKPSLAKLILRDLLSIRYVPYWYTITPDGMFDFGTTLVNTNETRIVLLVLLAYFLIQNGFILFNKKRKSVADFAVGTKVVRL